MSAADRAAYIKALTNQTNLSPFDLDCRRPTNAFLIASLGPKRLLFAAAVMIVDEAGLKSAAQ